MNLKRRMISCMILLILLAVICLIGYMAESDAKATDSQEQSVGEMGAVETMQMAETSRSSEAQQSEESEKRIALTFDDGPHPYYTEQLLDGLKERGVCATFFVTGEHAEEYPEIIERMSREGHLIGNHTYSHIQLTTSNREEFKQELIRTNEVITGITGEEVIYVRPPYGSWDKKFETEINMFPVLWNVDPLDWCSSNVAGITNKVVSQVEENDIILMHDYYASSVTAALKIVDELQAEGYIFVTVEEIMFD